MTSLFKDTWQDRLQTHWTCELFLSAVLCCCRCFQTFAGSLYGHSRKSDHWWRLSWRPVPIHTRLCSPLLLPPCPPAAGHDQLQDQRQDRTSLKRQAHICGWIFCLNTFEDVWVWCYWEKMTYREVLWLLITSVFAINTFHKHSRNISVWVLTLKFIRIKYYTVQSNESSTKSFCLTFSQKKSQCRAYSAAQFICVDRDLIMDNWVVLLLNSTINQLAAGPGLNNSNRQHRFNFKSSIVYFWLKNMFAQILVFIY